MALRVVCATEHDEEVFDFRELEPFAFQQITQHMRLTI